MAGVAKMVGLILLALLPGGLVALVVFLAGRAVYRQLKATGRLPTWRELTAEFHGLSWRNFRHPRAAL